MTTIPPAKKPSNWFVKKKNEDPERQIEVIRKDSNGNEIRKTCGSIGYQIFSGGVFKTFITGLDEANEYLDKLSG